MSVGNDKEVKRKKEEFDKSVGRFMKYLNLSALLRRSHKIHIR